MPELKRVLQLKRKTPAERGPMDPGILGAALNWHRIMDPEIDQTTPGIIKSDNSGRPSNGRPMVLVIPQLTEKGGSTSGN